tara:strand:+ start:8099 stop:9562 length:1464 start_codon:yes stop_codon:yes gene_type:complete
MLGNEMSQDNQVEEIESENKNKDKNRGAHVVSSGKDEINESNCKFNVGEPLKFVRVRFPGHAKSYPFLVGNRKLKYGQKVVAMSDRGMAVGYVNSFSYDLPFDKSMLPLKSINKIASEEDIEKEKETYKKQKDTETICQDLIEKHNLDMNLTHVEFTQFGKKVVFYFVAPARVDFRGLVKDLVSELRLRIELRQISVRDRAASQGALGPCGRELCCSSFLSRYGNVNIKMAKNQNLTLNYSKLNGVCGQLKCCLQYEDEVYDEKRKRLPREGKFIQTTDRERGKVFRLHILSEQFDLLTNNGKIKRYTNKFFDREIDEEKARMPGRFDHISDETATVIGLNEAEAQRVRDFEESLREIKAKTLIDTQDIFQDLMGVEKSEQKTTSLAKEVENLSQNKVEINTDLNTKEEEKFDSDSSPKPNYKAKTRERNEESKDSGHTEKSADANNNKSGNRPQRKNKHQRFKNKNRNKNRNNNNRNNNNKSKKPE